MPIRRSAANAAAGSPLGRTSWFSPSTGRTAGHRDSTAARQAAESSAARAGWPARASLCAVTEQSLDGADVVAGFQQVGGEAAHQGREQRPGWLRERLICRLPWRSAPRHHQVAGRCRFSIVWRAITAPRRACSSAPARQKFAVSRSAGSTSLRRASSSPRPTSTRSSASAAFASRCMHLDTRCSAISTRYGSPCAHEFMTARRAVVRSATRLRTRPSVWISRLWAV